MRLLRNVVAQFIELYLPDKSGNYAFGAKEGV